MKFFNELIDRFNDYRIKKLQKRVQELEIANALLFEMIDERDEAIEEIHIKYAMNQIERAKK